MTPTSPVTLSRDLIERDTMFFRGELDDGQGERWLQHDGAGNAWTPDAETLGLLNLIEAASRAVTETPEGRCACGHFMPTCTLPAHKEEHGG